MKMNARKSKVSLLVCMVLVGILFLSIRCSKKSSGVVGPNDHTIYYYSGGGVPGDFYTYTIDMTANTYRYRDITTTDSGSGTFTATGTSRLYETGNGDYFVMLPNEVIAAAVGRGNSARMAVCLKTTYNPYGTGIDGNYNFIGLEKDYGSVSVVSDSSDRSKGTVTGNVYSLGSGGNVPFHASYLYYNLYNAILLAEDSLSYAPGYYYYAVFVNNDVTVLDAYSSSHTGRGILVGVRELVNPDVSTYSGTYTYLDSQGGHGTYTIAVSSGSISSIAFSGVDGSNSPASGTIPGSTITNNNDGTLDFTFTGYPSRALLLPNTMIVVCIGNASAGGTYIVGIKQ